jgi:hypothetical protein
MTVFGLIFILLIVFGVGGFVVWLTSETPNPILIKRLAIFATISGAIYVGMTLAFPTFTHRYRLTIEIDTPDGVRSGSSVIEVVREDYRWMLLPVPGSRYQFRERSEAVFVDLGAGRNVIALLGHGARADNVSQMISLPIEAYGYYKWDENAWAGRLPMQGPVELRPPLVPTLIAFSNLSDPKTAQVVYATEVQRGRDPTVAIDRFIEIFGPGVRFRRASVEIVPIGTWPFNVLGWPRALTGDPITRDIENLLPWWNNSGRPAGEARRAWRAGETTGPSISPEMLFKRN